MAGDWRALAISLLLPCYNAARYLSDCLASLETQTLRDFEVLAVDDGSTDDTGLLLHAWAKCDARVRVLAPGRVGLVQSLRLAAHTAEGQFIARMDADDVADPQRLQQQQSFLQERPDVAACGTGVRYFPREQVRAGALAYERWLNGLHEPAQLAQDIFVECPIGHPTLMVRRNIFEAVGGYQDYGWPEDYDLILRLWPLAMHWLTCRPPCCTGAIAPTVQHAPIHATRSTPSANARCVISRNRCCAIARL